MGPFFGGCYRMFDIREMGVSTHNWDILGPFFGDVESLGRWEYLGLCGSNNPSIFCSHFLDSSTRILSVWGAIHGPCLDFRTLAFHLGVYHGTRLRMTRCLEKKTMRFCEHVRLNFLIIHRNQIKLPNEVSLFGDRNTPQAICFGPNSGLEGGDKVGSKSPDFVGFISNMKIIFRTSENVPAIEQRKTTHLQSPTS